MRLGKLSAFLTQNAKDIDLVTRWNIGKITKKGPYTVWAIWRIYIAAKGIFLMANYGIRLQSRIVLQLP